MKKNTIKIHKTNIDEPKIGEKFNKWKSQQNVKIGRVRN